MTTVAGSCFATNLNHPNIAAIHGFEEHNGTHFLVLELVEGDTLADRLNRGAIPVEESLKLALQIADALKAAHEKGVIHRDLKPLNIKVTDDDNVKVLDFGLAKAFAGDEAEARVSNSPTLSMAATQQGVILGTAAYMSPEQAKGRTVDKRADVWAFGCVLYEMLTGLQSFGASDVTESLAAVIRSEPQGDTLPTNLHPRLREVVERCLDKQAATRFQDIGDVKADIEKVLADPSGVLVQPAVEVVHAAPQSKLPWAAAIVLGMVVAGVAVWILRAPEPPAVSRSAFVLPDDQDFLGTTRPLLALSPDGRRLVYNADGGLHLRFMDELEAKPIPGAGNGTAPFFSPAGEWVGYYSEGQLMKIPIIGGAPIPITSASNPFGRPSWGADDMVVYGQPEGIMRVSADGGEPELLIAVSEEGFFYSPQMLPDGDSVLFAVGNLNAGQIVVQSLDTEDSEVLFPGVEPRYLPTGHLVYMVGSVLFARPSDVGSLQATGGPVSLVQDVSSIEGQRTPQYAVADAGSLAYVEGIASTGANVLALVDRNGLVEPLDVRLAQYVSIRLSPDGTRLAVQTIEPDGGAIWGYDLSGNTQIRQLTQSGADYRPIWPPDGERITFSSAREGPRSIFTQPADGSGIAQRLTTAEQGTVHAAESWSPNGKTLSFLNMPVAAGANPGGPSVPAVGNGGIWTISSDSGAEPELFYNDPDSLQASSEFSPDGNWLVYTSNESDQYEIYVQPYPATGARYQVTQDGGTAPIWSRDGSELFFIRDGRAVLGVEIDTQDGFEFGPEQTLPFAYTTVAMFRNYDITPGGEHFLLVQLDESDSAPRPQINIVLNWFEELKERVPVP